MSLTYGPKQPVIGVTNVNEVTVLNATTLLPASLSSPVTIQPNGYVTFTVTSSGRYFVDIASGGTKVRETAFLTDSTPYDITDPRSYADYAPSVGAGDTLAYVGYVHIFANSSTTYPTKASSIPSGYTGRIWWHDEDYVGHPGPTEQVTSDRRTKASA